MPSKALDRPLTLKEFLSWIPSLKYLVDVSSEEPLVIVLERDTSGAWQEEPVEGIVNTVALPGVGLEIGLVDLYRGTGIDDRKLRPLSIG
jgi:hypothetical protein